MRSLDQRRRTEYVDLSRLFSDNLLPSSVEVKSIVEEMAETMHGEVTNVGRRVETLMRALNGLSLEDGDREIIEGHLREIRGETAKPPKIKDLITFEPSKQKLRGWLTAADNFVYNQKIEGEEHKVRVISSYLRGQAWDWFEPILNEANNISRTSWEERTSKIMGNYREFKKALGKVFGELDERKTAAEKLAKLKQTTSVTAYITEFQTIMSSLDWDDEAKEDKYLEGLKQEIRAGLIYYAKEAEDLDELFERTQKIDREIQRSKKDAYLHRNTYMKSERSLHSGNREFRRDNDGDIIMKGAKVDLEKARREQLCFHCGKKGHQAKFCRIRKRGNDQNFDERTRKEQTCYNCGKGGHLARVCRNKKNDEQEHAIRMVRTYRISPDREFSGIEEDLERDERQSTEWASAVDDNEQKDTDWTHATEEQDENWPVMDSTPLTDEKAERTRIWVEKRRSSRINAGRGQAPCLRRQPRFTGRWPEDRRSHEMAIVRSDAVGKKEKSPREETTTSDEYPQDEEDLPQKENTGGLGSSGYYSFQDLKPKTRDWQERVGFYNDKFINRQKETNWETEVCNCYSFEVCWAFTNTDWAKHVDNCNKCEEWENRECQVPGHDPVSKRLIFNDISKRRHVSDTQLFRGKRSCCRDELCTHEFITHTDGKIPWWMCFSDSCEDHMAQKIRSQQLPRIPLITITNAQKCPCLRRGCQCNYDNGHPFHEALLTPPANVNVLDALKETIGRLEKDVANSNRREREIRKKTQKIRMVSAEQRGQLSTGVRVGKTTVTAIIDSGADINYVNEDWCRKKKIPYKMTGWGWIKGYNGEKTRTKILEASIGIRVLGKFCRTKFSVLKETGDDILVLGIPWLEKANPVIDWKRRTIEFHGKNSGSDWSPRIGMVGTAEEKRAETRTDQDARKKPVKILPSIEEEDPNLTNEHSEEYMKELREIQEKLPDEIKEFADVFCSED